MRHILFHLTANNNINSIMENGLIPDYTKGFARNKEKGWPGYPIWLTDSPQWVINTQLGTDYFLKKNIQILQVDVAAIEVFTRTVHMTLLPTVAPFEFVCFNSISPRYIKIVDTVSF